MDMETFKAPSKSKAPPKSKAPCKSKDPDHPSFWECKLKLNPHYLGTADEGPDKYGNTKMIRFWINPKTQRKMPFKPNFYTWKEARRYAERSCCMLKDSNPCRQGLVKIVTSASFKAFILTTIFLNTIFIVLPSYDFRTVNPTTYEPLSKPVDGCCDFMQSMPPPCDSHNNSKILCLTESCAEAVQFESKCCQCPTMNMVASSFAAEWIFLSIFLVEMIVKMLAFGVLPGPPSWYGSYFTDGWNILDFIIIMAALVTAPYPGESASAAPSFGFLRVIRVLRPLRTLSIVPSMRRMVQTLLISLTKLLPVLFLLSFIFLMFGALMIQVYAGELRYTCRHTNFPLQLPVLSLSSKEYNSEGAGWTNETEVNRCTYHDDWDNLGMWKEFFPSCNWSQNAFANTRKPTMHDKVFYHKLEKWPTRDTFKTQYFYFPRSKDWHRMHLELMRNASALESTNDPYLHPAKKYKNDLLHSTGVFRPCHDDEGVAIPISFEQCNRICYDQQVDSNGGRQNPCDRSDGARCEMWQNRTFDRYDKDHPMCAKYCPGKTSGVNWDLQDLKTPDAGLNSPWRDVTTESAPFYNGHRHCFWPNDNGDTRSANRYCSAWFRSVYDDAAGHNQCPANQYCGSDFDATGNLRFHSADIVSSAIYKEDLLWGIPQFNNFPEAFLSMFQSITLEGWVYVLYTVADRMSFTATSIIFVILVFIGGIFLVNMTLAVICDGFQEVQLKEQEKIARMHADPDEQEGLEKLNLKPVPCVQKSCLCCGTEHGHKDSKNRCLKNTHSCVVSPPFELFILICVLINFFTLCSDFYRAPFLLEQVLDYSNFCLTLIFFVEMVLKLIALGLRDYFKSNWNLFDFAIVVFSLIEYALSPPSFLYLSEQSGIGDFKVLRTLRVFRVFKIAKGWKQLSLVLKILVKIFQDVFYFFILLSIFLLTFAVWGRHLFANRFRFDPITNRPIPLELDPVTQLPTEAFQRASVPASNFDGLYPALLTVFQICSGEDWHLVMYDGIRSAGWETVFFFLVMVPILTMIILDLFVAILLTNFFVDEQEHGHEMERCCMCFVIGPKHEEEPDLLGSLSCCNKKSRRRRASVVPLGTVQSEPEVAVLPLGAVQSKREVAVLPLGVVQKEPEVAVLPLGMVQSKPKGILDASHEQILAVDGPLTRWLADCGTGMEQCIVEFYMRGVKQVSDFATLSREDLEEIGLGKEEIGQFMGKIEKKKVSGGIDMLSFEELNLLQIYKLQDDKRINTRRWKKLKSKRRKRGKRANMTAESQAEEQYRLTEKKYVNRKRYKQLEAELTELESKLTPDVKALLCIPRNKCRIAINYIVEYQLFDTLILVAILLSTFLLTIETPLMIKPGHWVETFFSISNWLFAWIFICEMVLKILAKGFVCHKHAYLRNWWNLLDFVVVSVSIVLMTMDVLSWAGFSAGNTFLGALRALRAMRALRPLRLIRRLPELRVIVLALLRSIPDVLQTLLVVGMFFVIFSVMGVNVYKGGFTYCDLSSVTNLTDGMTALEQCAPEGRALSRPLCTLWTDLSSSQRIRYIAKAENEADQVFTEKYNRALESHKVLDWDAVDACALSPYIANSITNWTKPGPVCAMKMTGESLFFEYSYNYYLMENPNTYLKPTSKQICDWMGGDWRMTVPQSFNNVLVGMTSWFELSSREGWVDAMYAAVAFRGTDMEPLPVDVYGDSDDFFARYVSSTSVFVFSIGFGTFLLTNMFVGTVCNVFQRMRTDNGQDTVFLTYSQKDWQRRQKAVMRLQPYLTPRAPDNPCREKVFSCAISGFFETFIFVCIFANTLIMMTRFFPTLIPQYWQVMFATEIANIVFALVFTLEAIFKIIGLGQQYFCKKNCRSRKRDKDGNERFSWTCSYVDLWNIFDFTIVVGTIFGLVTKYGLGFSGMNSITTLIRTFRVARIFRLVRHPYMKKLKLLLSAIGLSLPSICNLAMILLLFLCIFAILGVQLFAAVAHNDSLDDRANFENFPIALLTLFRATTGENWNGLMHALSRKSENCSGSVLWDPTKCGFCQWNQMYTPGGDSLKCVECEPLDGCGRPILSQVFFLIFTFFLTCIVLNIFVAVILESYEQSAMDEAAIVTEDDLAQFNAQWKVLDPDATMTIPLSMLPELMDNLPCPLGFKASQKRTKTITNAEEYEDNRRCVFFPPNLEDKTRKRSNAPNSKQMRDSFFKKLTSKAKSRKSRGENSRKTRKTKINRRNRKARSRNPVLGQREKQMAIDAMELDIHEEDGSRHFKFRDVLFACVQRAYKQEDPSSAFSIDDRHKDVLRDEMDDVIDVPIKTSMYLSALRVAQAYRNHVFRKQLLAASIDTTESKSSRASKPYAEYKREAFDEQTVMPMDTTESSKTSKPDAKCKREAFDAKTSSQIDTTESK